MLRPPSRTDPARRVPEAGTRRDRRDKQGVRGGLVAGGAFVLVGTACSLPNQPALAGLWSLRLADSLLLGPKALDPAAPLGPTLAAGALVHLALSAHFGLGFGALVASRRRLRRSLPVLVGAGALYGLGLWLVNVYAVAPSDGWSWVPEAADPRAQALAHALGFGVALALSLHLKVTPRRLGLA